MPAATLVHRALSAYFRHVKSGWPLLEESYEKVIHGRTYVVLKAKGETLACYRLTCQNKLRSLRRFPKEIA